LIHLGEKISKLVAASGVKIESFWTKLFAKALAGKDISSFFNFGGVSSGPAAAEIAAPAK
jgi:large subunit ribosomal protein LP1